MTTNEQQLESLVAEYTALLRNPAIAPEERVAIGHEQRFLTKILDDIRWQHLTDDQRQAKRKAKVGLLEKQSSQAGDPTAFTYERGVTELYDRLQETLRRAADTDDSSSVILRLNAFLLAEKSFIDADSSFAKLKHMDYYLWQNFFAANAAELAAKDIATKDLNACFHSMYKNWPNRPYKEI